MAQHRGPKTVSQDLIFHYDTGNVKSFAGKPATNFYNNGHFSGGNGIPQEGGSNPTNTIIQLANPGGSPYVLRQSGNYTEYQINLSSELSPNTTYVMSGWYAESVDYNGTSTMFHSRAFSSSGNHNAIGNGIGTVIRTLVVGGLTWKYCYATITTPSDYNNDFNWYVGYGQPSHNGYRYYTNLMMEVGTYPSPFVYLSSTNLIQNTNLTTWGTQSGVSAESTSLIGPTGKQDVYKINFGSYSGGDAIGTSITGTIGTNYTFVGWARADSNTTGYITIGRANSNPSVQKVMNLTSQWQRFEVSYVLNTNTTLYHNFAGQNTSYYVSGLEIKTNQRTNTEALLDLSKRSVMTVANASFDSSGMLNFDGTNDYIQLTSFTQPTNYITCEAWINPQDAVTPGTIRGGVISSTNSMYLGIFDSADGGSTFGSHWAVQTSTGARPYNVNGQIPRNQWTHIVGTYNGSVSRMYINGVEIWNASLTGTIPSATYYIGTYGGTIVDDTHNFNGYISVAKIYNRALTAEQVLQNFNASRRRFGL